MQTDSMHIVKVTFSKTVSVLLESMCQNVCMLLKVSTYSYDSWPMCMAAIHQWKCSSSIKNGVLSNE